jgi:hypothetical protein
MSSVADYAGRMIDVLAFDGATPSGIAPLAQVLAQPGQSGKVCSGIQKLGQRVLVELLTEAGSMPYAPRRGTQLMTLLREGSLRTQADFMQAVSSSLTQLQQNLWSEESSTDPTDEQFASATVVSVNLAFDTASVELEVTSVAGSTAQVILPIITPTGRSVA